MKNPKHVRCAECRYAVVNETISEYPQKKRKLKWVDIQCACTYSEYHRSTLNVSPNGNSQNFVSWGGCKHGKKRDAVSE